MTVDRSCPRWLRLRSACCWASGDVDLDAHADHVWLTLARLEREGEGRRWT